MSFNEPPSLASAISSLARRVGILERRQPGVPRFQDLADANLTKIADGQVPMYDQVSGTYIPGNAGGGGGGLLALTSRKEWDSLGGNVFGASWSVTLPSTMTVFAVFGWNISHGAGAYDTFPAFASFDSDEALPGGSDSSYSGDDSTVVGGTLSVLSGPHPAGTYDASVGFGPVNASGDFGFCSITVLGFVAAGGSIS